MRSYFAANFMKVRNTMKKTRLLSMLLAVALVFTSLPLMATAVAAEDAAVAAMEKGDSIAIPNTADNWTGVAAYDESYASAWIRDGGYGTFMVQLYKPGEATNLVTAGTEYVAKIAVRTADATFAASKAEANVNKTGTVLYMVHYQGYGTGYLGTLRSINMTSLTDTPAEQTINFTVPADTAKTWSLRLQTDGGNGSKYAPLGVAGITVYEAANPDNVVYAWGQYSDNNWATIASHGQTYHESVYLGADVTAATSATYDVADTKLLPGVYQLTGTFSTDADSVVLSAKVNDTVMTVGATTATAATIDTTATEVTYTLTIEEEMDLTALNLNWTVDGAATKLKLSDLSFECVDLIGASTNASIKRGTSIADNTSVAFWTTDDGNVDFTVDKWWNYPEFGKGYISVKFDAQYINESTDSYVAYVIMKHNGEADSTVRMKYRHGVSGYERYFNATTEWAEYRINTGSFWNANGNAPWGGYGDSAVASRNSFFLQPNSGTADIDIRGIKIVKNEGTPNETVVYAWGDYNGDYAALSAANNLAGTLNDESALCLTPDADGSTFNYNAASKNITLAPGTYVVSGSFAATSGQQTVQLGASAADGTVVIGEEFTVSEAYTPVTVEIEIESATTLADISVILGADVAVYAKDFKIAVKGEKFTAPNVGILMALLLKKKQAPKFEYTNLIPHVLTDAATDYWTTQGGTITVKETEGKQYLAFDGIEKNYQTFAYTPGVTLDAGTYQISGMMRTSVKGQSSQNRVWLGSVKLGSVKIDNQWASFSYTVTVDTTTELVLKFNGDAAEVFNKAYDIINLKVINLNEDPSYVAPEPGEEEEETKPSTPAKEYVDSGNEEVVLAAVDGSLAPDIFNDVGTDKWVVGDQSLTVKSQGGNLYLAMRDITVNHKGFTYKSGVTLEPGTYFFSADLRAAVKGQTTMLRAIINNETVVGNVWFNNDWSTVSGQFTVTAPTELTVKFFGGPDGSFIHDYDVTNILVTNIG